MAIEKRKVIIALLGLGVCILIILSIIKFGNLLAFLMVFPWIVDHLVAAGINIWLARLITMPIAITAVLGLSMALSFSAIKRNMGLAIFAISIALWSLAMFQMTKDNIFDPISGKAQQCYSVTPNGYEKVSCAWKVHPLYGTNVLSATREMVTAQWVVDHGLPVIESIIPEKNLRFFSQDGLPLVWYYQHPNGRLELFAQPGYHPQLNVALKPVDAEIVKKLLDNFQDDKQDTKAGKAKPGKTSKQKPDVNFNGLQKLKTALETIKTN